MPRVGNSLPLMPGQRKLTVPTPPPRRRWFSVGQTSRKTVVYSAFKTVASGQLSRRLYFGDCSLAFAFHGAGHQ